jgi:hypothetical protein
VITESFLKIFVELALEFLGVKREIGQLGKRLQVLEDMAREKERVE